MHMIADYDIHFFGYDEEVVDDVAKLWWGSLQEAITGNLLQRMKTAGKTIAFLRSWMSFSMFAASSSISSCQ